MAAVSVLVIDDHPLVRQGLRAVFEATGDVEVIAEADNGVDAVRLCVEHHPDVALMDLQLPGVHGIEATRQITHAAPATAVLVLTMFDEDEMITDALRAGARGYLLKGAEQQEIERAIRAVAAGEVIFSRDVAAKVLGRYLGTANSSPVLPELTGRERDVLDRIATGAGNSAIADALGLAPKTVGNHISSIFAKLGVSTRAEAIVVARRAGLGES